MRMLDQTLISANKPAMFADLICKICRHNATSPWVTVGSAVASDPGEVRALALAPPPPARRPTAPEQDPDAGHICSATPCQ